MALRKPVLTSTQSTLAHLTVKHAYIWLLVLVKDVLAALIQRTTKSYQLVSDLGACKANIHSLG